MDTDESSEREIRGRLADNAGVSYAYTLTIDRECHDWRVYDDGIRIGYAYCWFEGDDFAIKDWKFRDDLKMPLSWWRRLVGQGAETRNYRRRGLGSRLLPLMIAHARDVGAKRVTGVVATHDIVAFPGLLDWYRRYGFRCEVNAPGKQLCGKIELLL